MATANQINPEQNEMPYISDQETNTGSFERAKMENEEVSVQLITNVPDLPTGKHVPDLPTGKQHHVFISYAEVDQEFAYKLIEKLENVGYKICHHNKDFTPGWLITDNIKHCVMGSMKTIVILSNGAIVSPWCSYETEITLYMTLDMRKKTLIPLAIENCKIPDHLKPLTRIEYFNEKVDWWTKLLDAINAADEVPTFHSDIPAISSTAFGYNPYYSNLDTLVEIPSESSNILSQKLNKQYVPEELSRRGIQISQQEYEEVKDYINRHIFPIDGFWLYNKRFALWMYIFIFIVSFIPSFMFYKRCSEPGLDNGTDEEDECAWHNSLLFFAVVVNIGLLTFYILNIKLQNKCIELKISQINRRLMKHQVMTSIRCPRREYHFVFHFVYYNYQPCLDHLRTVLEAKRNQTNIQTYNESLCNSHTESGRRVTEMTLRYNSECQRRGGSIEKDLEGDHDRAESSEVKNKSESDLQSLQIKDDSEEEATSMLLKHSFMYLKSFKEESLPTTKSPRHTRHVICLCEYVEDKEGLVNSSSKKKSTFPFNLSVLKSIKAKRC